MAVVLGLDIGTTKITALALDTASGEIVGDATAPNDAETTSPGDKGRGRCEWDAAKIHASACRCLRGVSQALGGRARDLAGIGLTGQQHGVTLAGIRVEGPLYEAMNRLARIVRRGADGLRCDPLFTGTLEEPSLRGAWSGASPENFTPAHMTRALLEGMARVFRNGYDLVRSAIGASHRRLVGAGNGMRENPLLARIVAEEFALPLAVPFHREEAAFGAALLAAVGLGIFPDPTAARRLIRYQPQDS